MFFWLRNSLKASVKTVGAAWAESPYYADAERWTHIFWNEGSVFVQVFAELDLTRVIDLACGHGRHAEVVAPRAGALTLVDIHDANLNACRKRLAAANVMFQRNNGFDFRPLADASATAIYCYDAMVHFSPDIVAAYLKDTARVLAPSGRALYHHSNYPAPRERHYGQNPHARNHMTQALFRQLSENAGLGVRRSIVIDWGGSKNLDFITLVEKAG
jgi:ubiquinone/menaquinone biosynthesis C-methylase UbiE